MSIYFSFFFFFSSRRRHTRFKCDWSSDVCSSDLDAPPHDFDKQRRSAAGIEGARRRLKLLWIGAGLYSLIFLNGLRLGLENAGELPLVSIILGEVLNGTILATIIFTLRKVYNRVQQADRLASYR